MDGNFMSQRKAWDNKLMPFFVKTVELCSMSTADVKKYKEMPII